MVEEAVAFYGFPSESGSLYLSSFAFCFPFSGCPLSTHLPHSLSIPTAAEQLKGIVVVI